MSFTPAVRRDLTLVAGGRATSMLGDEVAVIALALWASHQGRGTLAVAALVMAATLPQLLAAPFAGLLVDRLPARRLIATVSSLQALVCLAVVPAIGADDLGAVLALVVALNVGQTIANPAWQALVPAIVAPEQISRALGTVQAATAGALLLGPAVGGLLVGAVGTASALVVDAVSFAVLAVVALALRGDRRPAGTGERTQGEMSAGIRLIGRDPVLRSVLVLVTALVLAAGAVNVAEIFLITGTLGAGPAVYGLVGALFAGGVMLGAVLAGKDRSVTSAGRTLVGVTISMACSMVVLGLDAQRAGAVDLRAPLAERRSRARVRRSPGRHRRRHARGHRARRNAPRRARRAPRDRGRRCARGGRPPRRQPSAAHRP